ncbi:MFS transporter [Gandjariella thermophila]|uniref:Tetracycline resistance protein n=1 Tax=Gandjariella thermophila TaxID=1931992 RepID=A0A4D4J1J1_9PSEU|nr:MFS transporter [Gandjariella thermophila]GDY30351.1 tetracycline resistance protein [Gandjariella thermophila]
MTDPAAASVTSIEQHTDRLAPDPAEPRVTDTALRAATGLACPAQRRALGVLTATQVLGTVGVATGAAVSALVAAQLSGMDLAGGLAQTSTVLGAALLAVPTARVAARRGRRPALLLSYAVAAGGAALAAAATALSAWPLLLLSLLPFGGGTAATFAARFGAADLARPAHRARAVSTVVWAATLGAVAGPNLAGPAGSVAGALGMPAAAGAYLLAATAFALAGAGVLAGLRPDPLVVARRTAPEGPVVPMPRAQGHACPAGPVPGPEQATGRMRLAVWWVLPAPARLALVGMVTSQTAMVGMMSMTPVHMNHGGASVGVVGIVISVHLAGMYAASPFFGWMADRLGRVPVLTVGAALVVAAAGIAGMAASHEAPQLGAGLTILGVGWSASLVSGSALLSESVPLRVRAAAQGLSDLVMNVGGALGAVLAGLIVTAWSYAGLGLAIGFAALPLLVACMAAALRPAG